MPYDAKKPPLQIEVRRLIDHAERKRAEFLLGSDANAHHEM